MKRFAYMTKRLLPLCLAVLFASSGLAGGVRTAWAAKVNDITSFSAKVDAEAGCVVRVPVAPAAFEVKLSSVHVDGSTTPPTETLLGSTSVNPNINGSALAFAANGGYSELDENNASYIYVDTPSGDYEVKSITPKTAGGATLKAAYTVPGDMTEIQLGDSGDLWKMVGYDASVVIEAKVSYKGPTLRINNGAPTTDFVVEQGGAVPRGSAVGDTYASPAANAEYYFPSSSGGTLTITPAAGKVITAASYSKPYSTPVVNNAPISFANNRIEFAAADLANGMVVNITTNTPNSSNSIKVNNYYTFGTGTVNYAIVNEQKDGVYAQFDAMSSQANIYNTADYGTQFVNGKYYIRQTIVSGSSYRFQQATESGSIISGVFEENGFRYIPVTLGGAAKEINVYGYFSATGYNLTLKAAVSNASGDSSQFSFYIRDASGTAINFENIPVTAHSNGYTAFGIPANTYRVGVRVPSGYTLENIKTNSGTTLSVSTDGDVRWVSVPITTSSVDVIATFKREAYMGIRIRKVIANNANNTGTAFTFHIRDKDGKSISNDNKSVTGNGSTIEYKLEPGDYRVYEVAKSGYALSGVTANGSSMTINTDGNDKYVYVTLSDSNQSIDLVFSNTQDNVTSGFTMTPNITKAKPGDAVTFTIAGFGNQSGQMVNNYALDIFIPQGLVFHQLTLPAFRNSNIAAAPQTGIAGSISSAYLAYAAMRYYPLGYDLKYITNLNGNLITLRGNLSSYSSHIIDSPPSLGYNEQVRALRIEIPTVPAGFAVGDTITLNCIVANDAPSSMEVKGNVSYRLPDSTLVTFASDAAPGGPVLLSTDSGSTGGIVDIVATGEDMPIGLYVLAAVLGVAGVSLLLLALRLGRRRN